MNADTGELQALREQAAAHRETVTLLLRTIAYLTEKRLQLQPEEASERPQLRVIDGGEK